MKQGGTILNIILLIAVAVLFYLHFSSSKSVVATEEVNTENSPTVLLEDSLTKYMELDSNISAKPIKIAYVNNDSLNKNLTMLRDVEEKIAAKEKQLKSRIENKQRGFENSYKNKIEQFKSKKNKYDLNLPNLSDQQIAAEREKLTKLQQEIIELEQTVQQRLYQFQQEQEQEYMLLKAEEMEKYYLKVQRFCQSFAKTLGFDFILIYQNGGSILYSNADYDISNYVVDAINKEYAQTKTSETDSE